MLAAIFGFQAALFTFATWRCSTYGADKVSTACPELGRRYDQTFSVMIATVLALLGAVKSNNNTES